MIFIEITSFFLILNFHIVNIIFLISLICDLRERKVPIKFFAFFFFVDVILNIFEYVLFFENLNRFIVMKVLTFIFVLFLSFLLFLLKIIGGSDGKLLILIFMIHPISILNIPIIFFFYLIFSFFFSILCMINFVLNNYTKRHLSFDLFFRKNIKLSILKNFYFKSFYKFQNFSELSNYCEQRHVIKSLTLIFNIKRNKFQILSQLRQPLIIIIIPSYYLMYYVKLIV